MKRLLEKTIFYVGLLDEGVELIIIDDFMLVFLKLLNLLRKSLIVLKSGAEFSEINTQ